MRAVALIEYSGYHQGMATVTEKLRQAVETCGQTRNAIAVATGISPSVLCRFVTDGRGLRSANIDRLCEHLDLELVPKKRARRTTKKKARR